MPQKIKETKIFIKKRKHWTLKEDQLLRKAIKLHKSNWKTIAQYFIGRNASQCSQRWKRIKPNSMEKKNYWTPQEDEQLKRLAQLHNFEWRKITTFMQDRSDKQIRERYINHLDPLIHKTPWTTEEDSSLWALYQQFGPRWSAISQILKGRPENSIKNRFNGHIRKFYLQEQNPYYIITQQKRCREIKEKGKLHKKNISSLTKKNTISKKQKKQKQQQKADKLDISFQSNLSGCGQAENSEEQYIDDSCCKKLCRNFIQEKSQLINFSQSEQLNRMSLSNNFDNNEDSYIQIEDRQITSNYEINFWQNQQSMLNCDQNANLFRRRALYD